jgi:hypothetical protein
VFSKANPPLLKTFHAAYARDQRGFDQGGSSYGIPLSGLLAFGQIAGGEGGLSGLSNISMQCVSVLDRSRHNDLIAGGDSTRPTRGRDRGHGSDGQQRR